MKLRTLRKILARPQLWRPLKLPTLAPVYEYRETGGAIRNGDSCNQLKAFINGAELCVKVRTQTGNRVIAAVKELIAMTVIVCVVGFACAG
jgi:hypothetical protein